MMQTCKITGKPFEITDEDLKFYEKMGVPPPTICPEERQRRRLAWRNERNLYHRTCDATGKKMISYFSSDKKFPVYSLEYWWSDNWDAKSYGRDFDFTKPFFTQFAELFESVPKQSLNQTQNENCDFINYGGRNKDCYLCFNIDLAEDCFYGNDILSSKNCVDCLNIKKNELCYECLDSDACYHCRYLQNCYNCSDSAFLKNCIGCQNCFGCVNLRNKQYYFFNAPCTKEEYAQKLASVHLESKKSLLHIQKNFFSSWIQKYPVPYAQNIACDHCTGDYLENSRNSIFCFLSRNLEDCKFVTMGNDMKDCYDIDYFGIEAELVYNSHVIGRGVQNIICSNVISRGGSDIFYSQFCYYSHDLFWCMGLRHAEYCIFNKEYPKEEYFVLKAKIIDHMKKTGEWGEFFPIEISPFGYNETVAQEYFPLEKPVGAKNLLPFLYKWKEEEASAKYEGPKVIIPDTIAETPDSICDQILECEECAKNYRIVKPELKFYRQMNIPIPHKCPNCRHKNRMKLRNPRILYKRNCDNPNCRDKKSFVSTYAPERPEKVLCEKCYENVVN